MRYFLPAYVLSYSFLRSPPALARSTTCASFSALHTWWSLYRVAGLACRCWLFVFRFAFTIHTCTWVSRFFCYFVLTNTTFLCVVMERLPLLEAVHSLFSHFAVSFVHSLHYVVLGDFHSTSLLTIIPIPLHSSIECPHSFVCHLHSTAFLVPTHHSTHYISTTGRIFILLHSVPVSPIMCSFIWRLIHSLFSTHSCYSSFSRFHFSSIFIFTHTHFVLLEELLLFVHLCTFLLLNVCSRSLLFSCASLVLRLFCWPLPAPLTHVTTLRVLLPTSLTSALPARSPHLRMWLPHPTHTFAFTPRRPHCHLLPTRHLCISPLIVFRFILRIVPRLPLPFYCRVPARCAVAALNYSFSRCVTFCACLRRRHQAPCGAASTAAPTTYAPLTSSLLRSHFLDFYHTGTVLHTEVVRFAFFVPSLILRYHSPTCCLLGDLVFTLRFPVLPILLFVLVPVPALRTTDIFPATSPLLTLCCWLTLRPTPRTICSPFTISLFVVPRHTCNYT